MTTNEHETCNNGCADCGCSNAEATQSEQTLRSIGTMLEVAETIKDITVPLRDQDKPDIVSAGCEVLEAMMNKDCTGGNSYATVGKELREVIGSTPMCAGVISTDDLVATLETVDPVAVIENVAAVIQQAKETVRIGAMDMSFSHQDDLILDRLIAALTKDGVEYPQLLNFIPPLESQRGTLLGEAVAYRDSHARAMTHFWTMLMSDVGNPATLAARARIDIGVLANYNDNAWMQWWDENIRPWCITYGHLFGPDESESGDAPQIEG